jgi:formate-dependent nitrite reductase cytochrome c552 subunit
MERASTHLRALPIALLGVLCGLVLTLPGCGKPAPKAPAPVAKTAPTGPTGVRYREVAGLPSIAAHTENGTQNVACATCHSVKAPVTSQRGGAGLRSFHTGLVVTHGNLTCLSCHNATDYSTLRLADGSPVAFDRVVDLCAQCHGPQAKAYRHGAHGGMSGYWDVTRGEQVRNQCTHCHAPHAPAFPSMQPTFKPRDRFLTPRQPANAATGVER